MIILTDCFLSKAPHWQFLEGLVERQPDISLTEIQVALHEVCGIDISHATVCCTLKRAGFSQKHVQIHAIIVVPHNALNLYCFTAYLPSSQTKRGMLHCLQDTHR